MKLSTEINSVIIVVILFLGALCAATSVYFIYRTSRDFSTELKVSSSLEINQLAVAISRTQSSLACAITRLRKRTVPQPRYKTSPTTHAN